MLHEGYRACVDDLDLEELKDSINANEVFQISAKTDLNIREAMTYLIKLVSPSVEKWRSHDLEGCDLHYPRS